MLRIGRTVSEVRRDNVDAIASYVFAVTLIATKAAQKR